MLSMSPRHSGGGKKGEKRELAVQNKRPFGKSHSKKDRKNMRLTLRTLLAYRDGVLDPKEAALLEEKIKESSTAQQISQRIETGMRNRKIAPIPVDAREFGFEANLVAEFLDDTIPMETLPDMERKCLENNTLLIEIGSCHQILSRAISVPASIPASLRQRIRELPSKPVAYSTSLGVALEKAGTIRRIDSPSSAYSMDGGERVALESATAAPKTLRKTRADLRASGIELSDGLGRQVPEYLIGNDRGWLKRAAMAACLLIALVVAGAIAIGPLDRVRILLGKPDGMDIAKVPSVPKPNKTESIRSGDEVTEPKDRGSAAPISESSSAPPMPSADNSKGAESLLGDKSIVKNESVPKPSIEPSSIPSRKPNRMQWLPDSKPSSDSIVLAKVNNAADGTSNWKRLMAGEYVQGGERVVVPPAQRTEIRIEPGIRWLCAGESDLELLPSTTDSARVRFKAGRALLFSTPDAKSIEVDCNGMLVSIRFDSDDACCGLEVQNVMLPCSDEMLQAGKFDIQPIVRLIGVQGEIAFSYQGPNEFAGRGALNVGQYVVWKQGILSEKQELVEELWWLRTSAERPIYQLASSELQSELATIESTSLDSELFELTKHRRGETAALAVRTRMMLGQYDQIFSPDGILNRKGLHSHWPSILAQIPQSLARQENRTQLVEAIRADAPNRANTILSLLIPKSQEQLSAGADKILVEALSSSAMDERIMAINQLSAITTKNLGYQPDKTSVDAVQQWRKMLGKNEIRYSESKIFNLEPNR